MDSNTIIGILIIVVLVAAGLWYVSWSKKKRMAEVWKGTVEKKWTSDQRDSDGDKIGTNYNIQVKLEDGKTKKLTVKSELWNSLADGNAVEKRAGEMDPVKI